MQTNSHKPSYRAGSRGFAASMMLLALAATVIAIVWFATPPTRKAGAQTVPDPVATSAAPTSRRIIAASVPTHVDQTSSGGTP